MLGHKNLTSQSIFEKTLALPLKLIVNFRVADSRFQKKYNLLMLAINAGDGHFHFLMHQIAFQKSAIGKYYFRYIRAVSSFDHFITTGKVLLNVN